jgi:protein NRD1
MDNTIPPGHIKVLSRTLFVGGANGNEAELRAIFGRYGPVQTCIANEDKRHAFVKMCNRQDAVAAKTAMETTRDPDVLAKARQTKWGVGFGPRECCDYSNGVSVIPIDTLTEADHKWMLSAEYGGTGGRPIESGLVVEEPDIEIGAGVSSKAMSRRVGPDGGSNRGGGGGGRRGGRGGGGGGGRFGQSESHHSHRPEPVTIAPPPPVPGFGFVPQFR